MRTIRYIESGSLIQLGFNKKELYLKFGELLTPMRLGYLRDIKKMGNQRKTKLQGKEIATPKIIKQMSNNITEKGLKMADNFTDEEFFQDFLKDYKKMSREGSNIIFVGEFNEWV